MSYLAWPVAINGKIMTPDGRPFHMTLKYLGKFPMLSLVQIKDRLAGHDVSPVSFHDQPKWQPGVWDGAGDTKFHVLELMNPPTRLAKAREAFADVLKDDFPIYRPHISLPKFYMDFFGQLGPGHILLELGPLMVMDLGK